MALVVDMLANPDMLVRTLLTYMLLVYAVYVPSTARHTLSGRRADDGADAQQHLHRLLARGIRLCMIRPPRHGPKARSVTWRIRPRW